MRRILDDPWWSATIERAISKHGARWTRAQRAAFREQMAWALQTHSRARAVLALARPGLESDLPSRPSDPGPDLNKH